MQGPLVVDDTNPARQINLDRFDLLQRLDQLRPAPATFRLQVEMEDVVEFVQVCRDLVPALQRRLAETIQLENSFGSRRSRRAFWRRWCWFAPSPYQFLTRLHLAGHGLNDKAP